MKTFVCMPDDRRCSILYYSVNFQPAIPVLVAVIPDTKCHPYHYTFVVYYLNSASCRRTFFDVFYSMYLYSEYMYNKKYRDIVMTFVCGREMHQVHEIERGVRDL